MRKILFLFLVIGIGYLSLGTVVKKKSAVEMTQTDPVSAQEKLKEEAEGKKGPPVPTFELFPRERFLTEGPVAMGKTPETTEESETERALFEMEEAPKEEFQGGVGEKIVEEKDLEPLRNEEVKQGEEKDDTWEALAQYKDLD